MQLREFSVKKEIGWASIRLPNDVEIVCSITTSDNGYYYRYPRIVIKLNLENELKELLKREYEKWQ